MSPTERIILGHKAWRLAARLLRTRCQRLQHRLDTQDQTPGRILAAEVERLQAEVERRVRGGHRRCHKDGVRRIRDRDALAQARTWAARWKDAAYRYRTRSRRLRMRFLPSRLDKNEAENEVARLQNALDSARASAARWKAAARYFWKHTRNLVPKWVTNLWGRVRAEIEVERLQAALDSANATCNRIQGDGNALADQLHAWRQACQDHGIEATPEALRAALRRVEAACVADAPRCHDCGRAAERVDGRWRPRCWCVGFADELAGADL